jgi:predicted SprT family Zn-dependent metalloprotease
MDEINQKLISEFNACVELARKLYPRYDAFGRFPELKIIPNMGKTAGMAFSWYLVHINRTLAVQNVDFICKETIPHEVAHIVCAALELDRGHGHYWKKVARSLGCSGERCFNAANEGIQVVKLRARKEYEYRASCGTMVWIGDIRHKKIQKGMIYRNGRTDGTIMAHSFTGKVRG